MGQWVNSEMCQWNTDAADGKDERGFFYGFALRKRMETDSFGLSFSVISTAPFPDCVIPTQEESHPSMGAMDQFGNVSMEYRDGEMKNGFSSLTESTENTEWTLRLVGFLAVLKFREQRRLTLERSEILRGLLNHFKGSIIARIYNPGTFCSLLFPLLLCSGHWFGYSCFWLPHHTKILPIANESTLGLCSGFVDRAFPGRYFFFFIFSSSAILFLVKSSTDLATSF
ncbi:hypothetical protein H9X57_07495 [Flavobacterium piscinae]|uniref:hypothetical protein n=1 Tax=Flavobacterium piscinae TaxID=2506424 RepID=UPI0019A5CD37|nr:hypothetical protein [Flavobacterium piscinae]MBC8883324.1 hypothetical protein [Flavobacterium piscinae]